MRDGYLHTGDIVAVEAQGCVTKLQRRRDSGIVFVADPVAPHKKVRAVAFVDTVPKSPSGEILRLVLEAEHA
ncbi:hypothetical protein [Streptomyces sp. B93]|uniref:hypothetical protein n=1 Tax=Streptomyces sp. B93 TaxID=2824875 RepID=UPI001B3994A7|nr:hypothetical protein [Streptomyces sp. B93]MBQ1089350.1 hypothetical protein [Streptomyces sp. B93]